MPEGMGAAQVADALRTPDLAGLDISVQDESERLL